MLNLFSTLIKGANARAVEKATDHFALDLIRQKIREAEQSVDAAKQTLASLIIRERQERRSLDQIMARKRSLEDRARMALKDGNEDLAKDAAIAIADLENEEHVRAETLKRLMERIARMRNSIEKSHRRVVDLRQGAITAQAIDMERKAQGRLNRTLAGGTAMTEAEKLIDRVVNGEDVLEEAEVLEEIDQSLSHENITDRMAKAGYGDKTKTSADDVLARLRDKTNSTKPDFIGDLS